MDRFTVQIWENINGHYKELLAVEYNKSVFAFSLDYIKYEFQMFGTPKSLKTVPKSQLRKEQCKYITKYRLAWIHAAIRRLSEEEEVDQKMRKCMEELLARL